MEYLIGIDSGGSKSELVAYDLDFNPIYKKFGGYGNPAVNIDITLNNISSLIESCLNDLEDKKCTLIVAGIAGVDMGKSKKIIEDYINRTFSISSIILNDAEMTAKAYLGNKDGIIAIAGTGASVYVQKDNKGEVVGGWGHILGDLGSGYHTVIEAFKRVAFQIDSNIPFDYLSTRLMKEINASNASDLKEYIYSNEKKTIASLFKIITELNEDKEGIRLLENAGKLLAKSTITACSRFEKDEFIKIGLKGGVFYNSEVVLNVYEKELASNIRKYTIIKEDISATIAVCNIEKSRRLLWHL